MPPLIFVEVTRLTFDVNGLLYPTFEPVLLPGFDNKSLIVYGMFIVGSMIINWRGAWFLMIINMWSQSSSSLLCMRMCSLDMKAHKSLHICPMSQFCSLDGLMVMVLSGLTWVMMLCEQNRHWNAFITPGMYRIVVFPPGVPLELSALRLIIGPRFWFIVFLSNSIYWSFDLYATSNYDFSI